MNANKNEYTRLFSKKDQKLTTKTQTKRKDHRELKILLKKQDFD